MDFFIVALFIAALTLGLGIGIRSIQADWKDPIIRGLSFRERWRLGKLARGQQPIADPALSRKAEAHARWIAWMNKRAHSPRHTVTLVLIVLITAALGSRDKTRMAMEGALLVSLLIAYLRHRRVMNEIERTAQINSWDLHGETGTGGVGTR